MQRLFIGLAPAAHAIEPYADLARGLEGARPVSRENLHITLRFIGEIGEEEAETVDSALSLIRMPGFEVRLGGLGVFPEGGKPKTLWVGVALSDALTTLQRRIDAALRREGLLLERRKFRPHMTLARLSFACQPSRLAALIGAHNLEQSVFYADRFTLFSSHLGKNGPDYRALADYPLPLE